MKKKKYYVYAWFNDETGELFYVGKGHGRRYKERKDRNPKFIAYINKYKCSPLIIQSGLDEKTAYEREKHLISLYRKQGMAICNFHDGGDEPPHKTGSDHPNSRPVVQLTLKRGKFKKHFDCINDAARAVKGENSAIVRACKKRQSSYGFQWIYAEEYDPIQNYSYKPKTVAKPILQYSVSGDFIKEWESAKKVEESLGIRRSHICSCLKGRYKTSGGYVWKYKSLA